MARQCSVCGRRPAVYYHRASGDYVCSTCFIRRLERFVRKAFGKYRLVAEPRPSIAYLIHPLLLVESIAGLHVFYRVEKGFTPRIPILMPRHICRDLNNIVEKLVGEDVEAPVHYYDAPPRTTQLCVYERMLRAKAYEASRELGVRYIAVPTPRDYEVSLAAEALLQLRPWCSLDAEPRLEAETITYVKPFYEILWEDLWGLAVILKVVDELENCIGKIDTPVLDLVKSAALAGGPELLYSFTHSIHALSAKGFVRCRACGGYEYSQVAARYQGLCRICASIVQG